MVLDNKFVFKEVTEGKRELTSLIIMDSQGLYAADRERFQQMLTILEMINNFRWLNQLADGMESSKKLDVNILYTVLQAIEERKPISVCDAVLYFKQISAFDKMQDLLCVWWTAFPNIEIEYEMELLGITYKELKSHKFKDPDNVEYEIRTRYLEIRDTIFHGGDIELFVSTAKPTIKNFIAENLEGWKAKA